jgi:hypothetical protein
MTWAIAAPLGVAFVGLWYLSIRVAFRIGLIKAYRCAYDLCEEVAEDISKRQRMAGVNSRVVLVSIRMGLSVVLATAANIIAVPSATCSGSPVMPPSVTTLVN